MKKQIVNQSWVNISLPVLEINHLSPFSSPGDEGLGDAISLAHEEGGDTTPHLSLTLTGVGEHWRGHNKQINLLNIVTHIIHNSNHVFNI